jgi:DNA-binding MarR family transcriptional regulator
MTAATTPAQPVLLDPEELDAWRGLLRTHSSLTKALDAELVREHGLPLSSYEVLLFLGDSSEGQMRMSDLADGVLLSRSGLTRLVDRLERAGLAERLPNPADRRSVLVRATAAGQHLFTAVTPRLQDFHRRQWSHLSSSEVDTLNQLLAKALWGAGG